MVKIVEILQTVAERTSELYKAHNPDATGINFIADTYIIAGNELDKRSKVSEARKGKYPAIILFTDHIPERPVPPLKQWKIEAPLHILIVTKAVQGNAVEKLEKVFYPVLYPIWECLI